MNVTIKNLDVNLAIDQLRIIDEMATNYFDPENREMQDVFALTDAIRDAISESHIDIINQSL